MVSRFFYSFLLPIPCATAGSWRIQLGDALHLLPRGGHATPEYRVATTGTAGSCACTIQWKNKADKAKATDVTASAVLPTQYTSFSFRVKLHKGSNQIAFVYGTATPGTSALRYAVVGLKGSSGSIGNDVLGTKPSTAAWSAVGFLTGR